MTCFWSQLWVAFQETAVFVTCAVSLFINLKVHHQQKCFKVRKYSYKRCDMLQTLAVGELLNISVNDGVKELNLTDTVVFLLRKLWANIILALHISYETLKHWTWDLNISQPTNPPTHSKVTANPAPSAPRQLSAPPSSCLPNDIANETSGGSVSHTEIIWANWREVLGSAKGGTHQLSHVSQYSSVTNSSFFHEISSISPRGFWPVVV